MARASRVSVPNIDRSMTFPNPGGQTQRNPRPGHTRTRPFSILALCLLPCTAMGDDTRSLTVMSFNSWHQWSQVTDGFEKAKKAIQRSGAEVVGLQESSPEVVEKMAAALGWHHAKGGPGSVQILSKHRIAESIVDPGDTQGRFIGAKILVGDDPDQELKFFSIHLDYRFYGPYAAKALKATEESVLEENARSERLEQVESILRTIQDDLTNADRTPVILTGDFNVPSHLDWTEERREKHGGLTIRWPETLRFEQAGLRDSFRVAHPDPKKTPGDTWSSIHKQAEPQDRIDFVLFKGAALTVKNSRTFTTEVETTTGVWGSDLKGIAANTWPSDHEAVVTEFEWAPSKKP